MFLGMAHLFHYKLTAKLLGRSRHETWSNKEGIWIIIFGLDIIEVDLTNMAMSDTGENFLY